MKKIATLVLSAAMMFGIASTSLASSVYIDYLVDGEAKAKDTEGDTYKLDYENIALGGNFQVGESWSISGEYADASLKYRDGDQDKSDFNTYKLKGGFAAINNPKVRLEVAGGYYKYENDDAKSSVESFIIGPELTLNLAKNMTLNAGLEYGISPKEKDKDANEEADMDSLLNARFAFNYYITENFGFSGGYRYSCFEDKEGNSVNLSGLTAGVNFRF